MVLPIKAIAIKQYPSFLACIPNSLPVASADLTSFHGTAWLTPKSIADMTSHAPLGRLVYISATIEF
jgi:hypothetical protein